MKSPMMNPMTLPPPEIAEKIPSNRELPKLKIRPITMSAMMMSMRFVFYKYR